MRTCYFAYGSNLKSARLLERVPGATVRGCARLDGYRIACDKAGIDGSGKANLHAEPGRSVWGALYELAAGDWPRLDAFEPRYERIRVEVVWRGARLPAQTYRSDRLAADATPFDWYRQLLLDGAREHGLPEDWCAELARWPCRAGTGTG